MQPSAVEIQFPLHLPVRSAGKLEPSCDRPPGKGRLPRVTPVMALAISFKDMIQRGEGRDYADLARLGCLTRERMSQIMELVWLAPDIQHEVLELPPTATARFPISEVAVRRIAGILAWEAQRQEWEKLLAHHHLL